MLIGCKQSKFLDLNPSVSLCCEGYLKCIFCLSHKEMLSLSQLLWTKRPVLPIFSHQTAALSAQGGLRRRQQAGHYG